MNGESPICPVSGEPMKRGVRPMTLTYKDRSTTIDMPGWYSAHDSVHSGADMKFSDRALLRLKAQAEGLPLPEEIRRFRRALGLIQREASTLLGGGPNAFQKYEAGEVLPSRAVTNLLRILQRHPEEVRRLRDEARQRAAAGEELDA
jgi:HTH-type transcriptional regulator / antitoxin MqsA